MRLTLGWGAKGLAVAALALAACTSKPAGSEARTAAQVERHADSGLPVIPLFVGEGSRRRAFRVEVAADRFAQAKGLMFRTRMGADEGMIFPMDPPRPASFWMKNTVIPLDLIFIGPDRRVLNIVRNAQPYSEAPLLSAGKVSAVLELNGGRAEALGIMVGDRVQW